MNVPRVLLILFTSLALGACASGPDLSGPQAVLHDEMFAPPKVHIATPAEIFAVTPAMQQFIDHDFASLRPGKDVRRALVDALYTRRQLRLDYDASYTRTAGEAFAARSGNCLSLVIMTAAFAHELGLPVRFQTVQVEDTWSRSSNLLFMSGHVDLSLGLVPDPSVKSFSLDDDMLTVDFIPVDELRRVYSTVVDEQTVVAMYMNNRAAEALNDGKVDNAYWWARAALLENPKFLAGYNTLAVIYRRHGQEAAAETSLRELLKQEPDNQAALSNLILVLNDTGRQSEAQVLKARLAELQPYPPFYYFDQGVLAMKAGKYRDAKVLFKKEIARAAYYDEFHFWLALADYGLGDNDSTRKEVALALENSSTRKQRDIYAAKLEWLNAHRNPAIDQDFQIRLRMDGAVRQ